MRPFARLAPSPQLRPDMNATCSCCSICQVPPEVPEPALGINFARDGMQRKDWLGLVAVHSDAWLLALAFYKGARLGREERQVPRLMMA